MFPFFHLHPRCCRCSVAHDRFVSCRRPDSSGKMNGSALSLKRIAFWLVGLIALNGQYVDAAAAPQRGGRGRYRCHPGRGGACPDGYECVKASCEC